MMDRCEVQPWEDVSAVLFDMDGLLVDSEPVWVESIGAFCEKRGTTYGPDDAAYCMGKGIPHSVRYLAGRHGWALDERAHIDEIEDDFRRRVPSAPAMRGAEDLLRDLHGRHVPLALGSSSVRPVIDSAIGGRGWLQLFDTIVTGGDVANLKPSPDIYLTCARNLGVHPESCVVLEDSRAGCESAKAAGMRVIAIPASDRALFAPLADVVETDLVAASAWLLGARAGRAVKPPGTPYAL